MVVFTRNQQSQTQRFVIKPNNSLSWQQVIVYFVIIAGSSLAVAVYFMIKGVWMALPFAGVEVLILGVAFYMTARRCTTKEVIIINASTLYIERGRYKVEQRYKFITAWTRVTLRPPEFRNYPSKLMIGSHGKLVEIACELCEEEKLKLANDLRTSLADATQTI